MALLLGCGLPCLAQDPTDPVSPDSAETSASASESGEGRWGRMSDEERTRMRRERTVKEYEPSGTVSVDRLPAYIEKFKRGSVYDERLYRFAVKAEHVPGTTGTIVLQGEVATAAYASGLENTLRALGFNIEKNDVELLPAESLGEKIYAVVTTSSASLRAMARDRSEQVNSVALGGMMRLLREGRPEDRTTAFVPDAEGRSRDETEERGTNRPPANDDENVKWYLAQSLEGYMGFVRADQVEPVAKLDLPDHLLLQTTTVTLEGKQVVLPTGTYLHTGVGDKLALKPGGEAVEAKLKTVPISKAVWTRDEVIAATESLDGTRYVWGGVTSNGIDCSGFTQCLWKARGFYLPRDAKQQASVGQIVAWGKDVEQAAEPGDLIFFTNDVGRISHVGASLGNGEMIHSGGGRGVHIVKLTDKRGRGNNTYLDSVIFARRMQGR